jgi:hypothetical protein
MRRGLCCVSSLARTERDVATDEAVERAVVDDQRIARLRWIVRRWTRSLVATIGV